MASKTMADGDEKKEEISLMSSSFDDKKIYETSLSKKLFIGLLCGYFAFQILFPWRYLLYDGNIFWTEEGYRFAWRVMLMEKQEQAPFL